MARSASMVTPHSGSELDSWNAPSHSTNYTSGNAQPSHRCTQIPTDKYPHPCTTPKVHTHTHKATTFTHRDISASLRTPVPGGNRHSFLHSPKLRVPDRVEGGFVPALQLTSSLEASLRTGVPMIYPFPCPAVKNIVGGSPHRRKLARTASMGMDESPVASQSRLQHSDVSVGAGFPAASFTPSRQTSRAAAAYSPDGSPARTCRKGSASSSGSGSAGTGSGSGLGSEYEGPDMQEVEQANFIQRWMELGDCAQSEYLQSEGDFCVAQLDDGEDKGEEDEEDYGVAEDADDEHAGSVPLPTAFLANDGQISGSSTGRSSYQLHVRVSPRREGQATSRTDTSSLSGTPRLNMEHNKATKELWTKLTEKVRRDSTLFAQIRGAVRQQLDEKAERREQFEREMQPQPPLEPDRAAKGSSSRSSLHRVNSTVTAVADALKDSQEQQDEAVMRRLLLTLQDPYYCDDSDPAPEGMARECDAYMSYISDGFVEPALLTDVVQKARQEPGQGRVASAAASRRRETTPYIVPTRSASRAEERQRLSASATSRQPDRVGHGTSHAKRSSSASPSRQARSVKRATRSGDRGRPVSAYRLQLALNASRPGSRSSCSASRRGSLVDHSSLNRAMKDTSVRRSLAHSRQSGSPLSRAGSPLLSVGAAVPSKRHSMNAVMFASGAKSAMAVRAADEADSEMEVMGTLPTHLMGRSSCRQRWLGGSRSRKRKSEPNIRVALGLSEHEAANDAINSKERDNADDGNSDNSDSDNDGDMSSHTHLRPGHAKRLSVQIYDERLEQERSGSDTEDEWMDVVEAINGKAAADAQKRGRAGSRGTHGGSGSTPVRRRSANEPQQPKRGAPPPRRQQRCESNRTSRARPKTGPSRAKTGPSGKASGISRASQSKAKEAVSTGAPQQWVEPPRAFPRPLPAHVANLGSLHEMLKHYVAPPRPQSRTSQAIVKAHASRKPSPPCRRVHKPQSCSAAAVFVAGKRNSPARKTPQSDIIDSRPVSRQVPRKKQHEDSQLENKPTHKGAVEEAKEEAREEEAKEEDADLIRQKEEEAAEEEELEAILRESVNRLSVMSFYQGP